MWLVVPLVLLFAEISSQVLLQLLDVDTLAEAPKPGDPSSAKGDISTMYANSTIKVRA